MTRRSVRELHSVSSRIIEFVRLHQRINVHFLRWSITSPLPVALRAKLVLISADGLHPFRPPRLRVFSPDFCPNRFDLKIPSADVKDLEGQVLIYSRHGGSDLLGGGSYCPFDVILSVWSSWAVPHVIRFIGQRPHARALCSGRTSFFFFFKEFIFLPHFQQVISFTSEELMFSAENCRSLLLQSLAPHCSS